MAKKKGSSGSTLSKAKGNTSTTTSSKPKGETTPFTQPAPSTANRTVAGVLGEIAWLMTQSPTHKGFFISDLEWMIMVPVMLQQFRLFYDKDKPIGVALYARVNDEVEERLKAGNAHLRPQDWKCGSKLWIVEIIAPFGGHEAMMQDFKEKLFSDTDVHYLLRSATGDEVRVV